MSEFPIFRHFKGGEKGQYDKFTAIAVTLCLDLAFAPASNFAAENGSPNSLRNSFLMSLKLCNFAL